MPCGLPEIGGASLKSIVFTTQSWALEATPVGGVLDTVWHALQSGRDPTGHPATKPKLLEEWIWLVQLLYDCLFTVLQSLQCCNGKHGILLVQLLKQLGEVCYNHTPITHTCIITSHIIFAYDNFTHIDCNSMNHQILRDALGLTFGIFPLTDQGRCISLKYASFAKVACFQACTARTEGQQVMCRSNVGFKTMPDISVHTTKMHQDCLACRCYPYKWTVAQASTSLCTHMALNLLLSATRLNAFVLMLSM